MAKTYIFLTDKQPATTAMMQGYIPAPVLKYAIPPSTNTGTPVYVYMTDTSTVIQSAMRGLTPPATVVFMLPNHIIWERKGDYPWNDEGAPQPAGMTAALMLPDLLDHNIWIWANGNEQEILYAQESAGTYGSVLLPDVL